MELTALSQQWQHYKDQELAAKSSRLSIEEKIESHGEVAPALPNKGTAHFGDLTIKTDFNRCWNQRMLLNMRPHIPDDHWPFELVFKEDRVKSKALEKEAPAWAEYIAKALTLDGKKAHFSIKKDQE